jgi:hypothetical protein
MEISNPRATILVYLLVVYLFFSLLPSLFSFLLFLLDFISSLSQLAWEKGFDVVVVGL